MAIEINANRLIRIERPVPDNSLDGAGSGTWALVAEVWAEVQDMLPARSNSVTVPTTMMRPARIRVRYRTDVMPEMRVVHGTRRLYILSGPAEIGNRDGIEFMAAEYLPGGNPA